MIITTLAEDEAGRLHDRMPMVIDPARWDDWLDPANNRHVRGRAPPARARRRERAGASYPVGTDVNYVRNNGPGLITPMAPDTGGDGAGRWGPGETAARAAGPPPAPASTRTRDRHRPSDSAPLSLF